MIPVSTTKVEPLSWQKQLAGGFDSPKALFDYLQLDPKHLPSTLAADGLFKTRVPLAFAKRMQKGDLDDPLLLQVLPSASETMEHADYSKDPLAELQANPLPGLLHKYHGRVLLMASQVCAVNCRYCFRRHFPYAKNRLNRQQWQPVYDYIAADRSIKEVILSGGDPLMLTDSYLQQLIEQLSCITHVTTLRIHTRLGIVLPARITAGLLNLFKQCRLQIVWVNHCNHANEIDESVINAMRALQHHDVTLLNQSVLLNKINHTTEALVNLSHRLFQAGVLPYYLHCLDKTQGTQHFAVDDSEAKRLIQQLRQLLPGYLVPQLVYEQAGAASKLPLT